MNINTTLLNKVKVPYVDNHRLETWLKIFALVVLYMHAKSYIIFFLIMTQLA